MQFKYFLLFPILVILFAIYNVWTQESTEPSVKETEEKLREIEAKLQEEKRQLKSIKKKEDDILSQVNNVNKELNISNKLLKNMDKRKKMLEQKISDIEEKISQTETKLKERQILLSKRLRNIYEETRFYELEVLLSADSFTDLINRYYYLQLLADYDLQLYKQIKSEQEEIKENKIQLQAQIQKVETIKRKTESENEAIKEKKKEKEALLSKIRDEKSEHEKALKELEASARELQGIITKFEKKQGRSVQSDIDEEPEIDTQSPFGRSKGKLMWPLDKGTVISLYGKHTHPKFKTVTVNQGINIKADRGTPIKAVWDGKVVYAGWLKGYGNLIIIEHTGGYYTLYAYTDEIFVSVGNRVSAGYIIASVGDSGSVDEPCLHFQIRKGIKPLNPLLWLKKR